MIRDFAEGGLRRVLRRRLRRVRRELLTAGLDSRVCGHELASLTTSPQDYTSIAADFELISVSQESENYPSFVQGLRDSQHEEATRLHQNQEHLQEILSVTSAMGVAVANMRMQWLAFLIAVVSLAVAILK